MEALNRDCGIISPPYIPQSVGPASSVTRIFCCHQRGAPRCRTREPRQAEDETARSPSASPWYAQTRMGVRASVSGVRGERSDEQRLALGSALALMLHALLFGAAFRGRAPDLERILASGKEVSVQVEELASEPPLPTGGDSSSRAEAPEEPAPIPPERVPRVPRRPPKTPAPKPAAVSDNVSTAIAAKGASVLAPEPTGLEAAPARSGNPIPSDSRSRQRIGGGPGYGGGTGTGGLFGNGHALGDGPGALKARVCFIPETTRALSQIGTCDVIFEAFLDEINVPLRRFEDGFPGFEDRTEWFSVTISGPFILTESGEYRFRLKSDDGSKLYIDRQLLIDNDGIHSALSKRAPIELSEGRHEITVRYFQGMKYELALQLFVTPPGGVERLFNSQL